MGVAEATFHRGKKRYGGLSVTEIRRLKQLEAESRRLEKLAADLTPDKAMLQEVLRKKPFTYSPPDNLARRSRKLGL